MVAAATALSLMSISSIAFNKKEEEKKIHKINSEHLVIEALEFLEINLITVS